MDQRSFSYHEGEVNYNKLLLSQSVKFTDCASDTFSLYVVVSGNFVVHFSLYPDKET